MNPNRRRLDTLVSGALAVALVGTVGLGWAASAAAQVVDCNGLRRRIAVLERGQSGQAAARYARSIRRQQIEIDRTMAYRRSLRCDSSGLELFSDGPPAACGQIDARIERMNANLATMQDQAARITAGDADEREELAQRYSVYCREPDRDERFGPDERSPEAGYQRMPLEPGQEGPSGPSEEARPAESGEASEPAVVAGGEAVCVKTCDGSFFPVSYSATPARIPSLEALCHASCPNAETKVYTLDMGAEIGQAVDKTGAGYTDMPNANRYSRRYDPMCSCRAPGKTWLETLVEAEKLYAGGAHDIVVTQQMSDALARAAPTIAVKAPRSSRRRKAMPAESETADATTPAEASPATAGAPDIGLRGSASPDADGGRRHVRMIAPNP